MRKKFLSGIVMMGVALALYGCSKKQMDVELAEYSMQIGAAQGSADFGDMENPDIAIKDIRSYVGKEIDYSSGVEITNMEQFDDFQMWVDATGVDIYTVGKYTATYRFVYGGKEMEKTVGVTILTEEEAMEYEFSTSLQESTTVNNSEGGANHSATGNTNANPGNANSATGNTNSNPSNTNSATGNTQPQQNPSESTTVNNSEGGANHSATGNTNANPGNANSATGNTNANPGNANSATGNTQPQQNPSNSPVSPTQNTTTAKREIITTVQKGSSVLKTVGYTNIELLSGKYVKLKCTNAKYIVSTRTDVSQTNKNGQEYKVSKLIITYNTGVEQVLETVEEAVR